MNGKRPKRTGARHEGGAVKAVDAYDNLSAHKQPLSGAIDRYPHDLVIVDATGDEWTAEHKYRTFGLTQIYRWKYDTHDRDISPPDVLLVKSPHKPRMAVLDYDDFLMLLNERKASND